MTLWEQASRGLQAIYMKKISQTQIHHVVHRGFTIQRNYKPTNAKVTSMANFYLKMTPCYAARIESLVLTTCRKIQKVELTCCSHVLDRISDPNHLELLNNMFTSADFVPAKNETLLSFSFLQAKMFLPTFWPYQLCLVVYFDETEPENDQDIVSLRATFTCDIDKEEIFESVKDYDNEHILPLLKSVPCKILDPCNHISFIERKYRLDLCSCSFLTSALLVKFDTDCMFESISVRICNNIATIWPKFMLQKIGDNTFIVPLCNLEPIVDWKFYRHLQTYCNPTDVLCDVSDTVNPLQSTCPLQRVVDLSKIDVMDFIVAHAYDITVPNVSIYLWQYNAFRIKSGHMGFVFC